MLIPETKSINSKRKLLAVKSVEQHLQKASVELEDFFNRIDKSISSISPKVVRYTTHDEIIYKKNRNFVYLTVQPKKNCLKLYLRTMNGEMIDLKQLTKPARPLGYLKILLSISPGDEKAGIFSIDYIIGLIRQSYDSTE
jgi:predicted transport protein